MKRQKAVLVLDMPKRCEDCWLANFQRDDCYCFCMGLQKPVDYDNGFNEMDTKNGDWRWDKCPLKELPEEITPDDSGYNLSFTVGYNSCLNAIEGTED